MKNEEFKLNNLPIEAQDPTISADDFKLVQKDDKIHDQKFETKPTTFLKDCLKRFCKNKSSVVAAFILGILLLLSIIVPFVGNSSVIHSTRNSNPEIDYLEPRLFKSGTGFWDGTKRVENVPVDPNTGMPDPDDYNPNAISEYEAGKEKYTTTTTKFGKDGYVQIGYFDNIPDNVEYISYTTTEKELDEYVFEERLTVDKFESLSISELEEAEPGQTYPKGYGEAECALFFKFSKGIETYSVQLTDYAVSHHLGEAEAIDVKAKFEEVASANSFSDKKIFNPMFEIRVKNALNHSKSCAMVKSFNVVSEADKPISKDTKTTVKEAFEAKSFKDGNSCLIRTSKELGYWKNTSKIKYSKVTHYLPKGILASFKFDTYEAVLGKIEKEVSTTELKDYKAKGYLSYTITSTKNADGIYVVKTCKCEILDEKKCPLTKPFTKDDVVLYENTGVVKHVKCEVDAYKVDPYNLTKMPKFLLGTDTTGRDMFVYVFEGLRTSLLLGVGSTIVCFLFGLFWGSVCGYFGGTVDLIMERFTDILSGVPWIVVMTLVILKAGKPSFGIFALALCLTGWIGTAATTRTQFYRFRGREYVLASRTLGASHGRLIAKHILPNAMGTIITSAVLMVPSVIFEEATLSYLGLAKLGDGDSGLSSLGVILSDNQVELTNHPYLLIFPSIIIALIMISFNLFGNGLRDAVNPSLKGEGE